MAIQTGQQAPDFELYDTGTELTRLSDFGGENVLLLFFPGAFTSVCTSELQLVNDDLEEYEDRDVQVVAVSTDAPAVLAEFKDVHQLDFPMLSDHDATVAAEYGAKYDRDYTHMKLDRIAKRAAFVIDRDGVVRYAEVLDDAGEMPDFDRITETIETLD